MKAVDYYVKVGAYTKASSEESSTSCSSDHNNIKCNTTSSSPVLRRARYRLWFTHSSLVHFSFQRLSSSLQLRYPCKYLETLILEVEEREKVVRHMWDVYTHSKKSQLPRFWRRAFEAAYEDLVSDVSALLEIARMSLISLDLILEYSVPQSTTAYETDRQHTHQTINAKQAA